MIGNDGSAITSGARMGHSDFGEILSPMSEEKSPDVGRFAVVDLSRYFGFARETFSAENSSAKQEGATARRRRRASPSWRTGEQFRLQQEYQQAADPR